MLMSSPMLMSSKIKSRRGFGWAAPGSRLHLGGQQRGGSPRDDGQEDAASLQEQMPVDLCMRDFLPDYAGAGSCSDLCDHLQASRVSDGRGQGEVGAGRLQKPDEPPAAQHHGPEEHHRPAGSPGVRTGAKGAWRDGRAQTAAPGDSAAERPAPAGGPGAAKTALKAELRWGRSQAAQPGPAGSAPRRGPALLRAAGAVSRSGQAAGAGPAPGSAVQTWARPLPAPCAGQPRGTRPELLAHCRPARACSWTARGAGSCPCGSPGTPRAAHGPRRGNKAEEGAAPQLKPWSMEAGHGPCPG